MLLVSPGYVLLVHFKSTDLARLHAQGQFWHIFFPAAENGLGGAIIAQNEVDTWTTHLAMPLDADHTTIDSAEAVARVLGGMGSPYPVHIDEILVRSTFRPYLAIARKYGSASGRIFLAGDACHQNIPTGGYGMNMGLGDAFDLGWKLAATINGFGGAGLLDSYEQERRPVAVKLVERSGVHMKVHTANAELLQPNPAAVDHDTEEGRALRQRIHDHYQANDGENRDIGAEMGYRYESVIINPEQQGKEPEWTPSRYIPTTWPGGRAPHVFLNDGSAIFDHYGSGYTLVEFSDGRADLGASFIVTEAQALKVPLKHLKLVNEDHARKIWERPLVLVRPDGHVSWRGENIDQATARRVVEVATGHRKAGGDVVQGSGGLPNGGFSATIGTTVQEKEFELARMGDFQR
jgi:FAD-dependent monooxygenase